MKQWLVGCGFMLLVPLALAQGVAPTIVVSGEGEVMAVPDRATISLQVEQTAMQAEEARRQVDQTTQALLAAARKHGVRDQDMDATQLNVTPSYEWTDRQRHYLGMQVSRQVSLRLNDLNQLTALMSALVAVGPTQVNGAQLDFARPAELQRQALARALEDARAKAELIAKQSGVRLGAVQRVVEQGAADGLPGPMPRMAMMMAADAKAESMPAGERALRTRVSVEYLIAP